MIWSLIGSIEGKVLDIVDDVVEDKDEANRLKFEIQPSSSKTIPVNWKPRQISFWQKLKARGFNATGVPC